MSLNFWTAPPGTHPTDDEREGWSDTPPLIHECCGGRIYHIADCSWIAAELRHVEMVREALKREAGAK